MFTQVTRDPVKGLTLKLLASANDLLQGLVGAYRKQFPEDPKEPTVSELTQQMLDAWLASRGSLPVPVIKVDPTIETRLELKESTATAIDTLVEAFQKANPDLKNVTRAEIVSASLTQVYDELSKGGKSRGGKGK
jgi:hypothetical protein